MSLLDKYGLKKGDLVIFAVILLVAALAALPFLLPQEGELVCEITQGGTLVRRLTLTDDSRDTIVIEDKVKNVIEIEGKTVRFAASDCPDQVCVRTGTLDRAGQLAVCLPNEVIVRLSAADGTGEVDAIA